MCKSMCYTDLMCVSFRGKCFYFLKYVASLNCFGHGSELQIRGDIEDINSKIFLFLNENIW